MNIQAIMKQAQEMQKKIGKAQAELETMTFIGKSSFVEVEITGSGLVKKVSISSEDNIDNEMLEDMILIATNEAMEQMKKEKERKLGSYTQGMSGLF